MPRMLHLMLASVLLAGALGASAATDVSDTIEAMAATADPGEYITLRAEAVSQGPGILGDLERLREHGSSWRAQAAAAACEGWLLQADLYQQFAAMTPAPTAAGTSLYRAGTVVFDERLTPLLVERLVWTETDPAGRAAAADLLQRIRDPRAVPALAYAVREDGDLVVRLTAADALARNPAASATLELTEALASVGDADVRTAVAGALGWRKDPTAAPALLVVLTSDEAPGCRARAAQSLGWLRDPALAPPLATALLDDPDAAVRGQAALALGKAGGDRARAALQHAITSDPDAEVVRLATSALGRL